MDLIWLLLDAIIELMWWVSLITIGIVVAVAVIVLGLVGLYSIELGRGDDESD
jgi:hypothetical protein